MFTIFSLLLFLVLFIPQVGFTANTNGSLQDLLIGIGGFINAILIPFILAIAFLVFVINVVRFFVITSTTDEGQKNARNLAFYGIGAFVFILSFWGIINFVISGFFTAQESNPDCAWKTSDYININVDCDTGQHSGPQ